MANQEHLDILKQGVEVWNQWRREHLNIQPDFSGANLSKADLSKANLNKANLRLADLSSADLSETNLRETNFSGADLRQANLSGADLWKADLWKANFRLADLSQADFSDADLSSADLSGAYLRGANLSYAHLNGANLSGADLSRTILVGTDLTSTTLKDCTIYGISAWDVQLDGAEQLNLTITPGGQPTITVDNLKVAQFIYLLLNNSEIRDVIDTITSKVVLILGRFTPERKRVLDALKEELRKKDFLPIVFDFDVPTNRNVTETVTTLARLARFIIADLTNPKSIPQELSFIVPDLPSVPVQPLLHARSGEYGMYAHFKSFPWVLPAHRYTTVDRLLASLREHVIEPAENRAKKLDIEKTGRLKRP